MKKLLSLILLMTLSFTFSACGDSNDDEEKFVWGGDWNDPDDPNYKPEYEGKYNPVQGLWKFDWDKERGVYFSEDFKIYLVTFYANGLNRKDLWINKYEINDKAYGSTTITRQYKIEGNRLYEKSVSDTDWYFSTKVEE